ncbi:chromosomal replication initiator protein DnaA [Methylobacterium nodulans]|uniref:Chromosomal replication initiator DnaA n=1 Tax=Methylobacterium nodulans (strain LMG 21967 / CNCM I-2342 / ORS 2060) TaxID=460265 RepID=B8IP68_METNO|nr:chromosomal replication initiator protein DnaA [Methylobacterium nodulans]ACL60386.1 Chromosomal replication initiator DnaA [Methylobacterium nodulans ORS 2060]
MPDLPRQLTLDLPLDPRFGPEDFLVGPSNEAAYARIESWPHWPDPVLVLTGPSGSGKSHLAAVWAAQSGARTVGIAEVTGAAVPQLAEHPALVIEDADRRSGRDEAALFHLLNLARERGTSLVITGAGAVEGWGIATPDLRSRLRLAPTVAIAPPDEALLRAVLVKLFVDRQLVVDTSVVDALALRIDRSLGRARDVVAALDREGLARGRRITRPLALATLASLDDSAGEGGP